MLYSFYHMLMTDIKVAHATDYNKSLLKRLTCRSCTLRQIHDISKSFPGRVSHTLTFSQVATHNQHHPVSKQARPPGWEDPGWEEQVRRFFPWLCSVSDPTRCYRGTRRRSRGGARKVLHQGWISSELFILVQFIWVIFVFVLCTWHWEPSWVLLWIMVWKLL